MFEYCIHNGIKHLYLTVYDKQVELIRLLNKFGFKSQIFTNSQGSTETRMIKSLDKKEIDSGFNSISHHPFYYDNSSINKYVIPIRPDFYNTLFKDGRLREKTLFENFEFSINEIQGNTIIKAYISNSKNKKPQKGDLLFFYASKERKIIEPIGVLESLHIVDNFNELWDIVRKKTVFSQEDLTSMLKEKGSLHVIVFRLITYMGKHISFNKIKTVKSFSNNIQSITSFKEEDYLALKDEGYFDGRYIID